MTDFKPSEKSAETTAALDEIAKNLFGRSRTEAIKSKTCVVCGASVEAFRDALSEREFTISGLCQTCQDDVFGEE